MWGTLVNQNKKISLAPFVLKEPIVTIGRNSENTIKLSDLRVSKFHCKLEFK
jgi:hypothetical protein